MISYKTILKNGGATVNYCGKRINLKSGYQVSKQDLIIIDIKDFKQAAIAKVMKAHATKGSYIGFWVDNNKVYIDKSERIATKKNAIMIGKQRNQISIWNWKQAAAIYC